MLMSGPLGLGISMMNLTLSFNVGVGLGVETLIYVPDGSPLIYGALLTCLSRNRHNFGIASVVQDFG